MLAKRSIDGLLFLCAISLVSCVRLTDTSAEKIIAKVNERPIYFQEAKAHFNRLQAEQDEISRNNPKIKEQLKIRALNQAIVTAILNSEAERHKIRVAKEEVEARLASWKESYPPGGFEKMLLKRGSSEKFLKARISEQLLIEKLTTELFSTETLVSDEEMKAYYKANEKSFYSKARVHVQQILVPTKEEAERIRAEVVSNNLTFESAARKYSLSPDAVKGGDMGFFSKNEKLLAFNKAFALSVGSISQPIQTKYGVHLLKVKEKQKRKKLSFSQAKKEIFRALRRDKEARVYKEWLAKLIKEGQIYRNETLFAALY